MRFARGGAGLILAATPLPFLFAFASVVVPGPVQRLFEILAVIACAFVLLLAVFFRDPERVPGGGIVAAADGKVTCITDVSDPDVGPSIQICTFLNLHNVHVTRMPADGTVTSVRHDPGGHLPAFLKDSPRNERVTVTLQTAFGPLKVVHIAGTLARRIVPYVHSGDVLRKGDRLGLIRFGSRVDVFLPKDVVTVAVRHSDRVKAGGDTLATLHA